MPDAGCLRFASRKRIGYAAPMPAPAPHALLPVFAALGPVFGLIALGYGLRRGGFPGAGFWQPAERLSYYLLLPALLVRELARADFGALAVGGVIGALLATLATTSGLALWLRPRLGGDGPAFGATFQGAIRLNTYVGLATALPLYGARGGALAALALAIMVPVVNLLSVTAIAHALGRAQPVHLLRTLAGNPLILACLAGIALNAGGIGLPPGFDGCTRLLAQAALPLGLLAMGAALQIAAVRGRAAAIVATTALKLVVAPLIATLCAGLAQLPPLETAVVVLFAALPAAPSAYILAREMGADAALAAVVITVETLAAMVTLPLIVLLAGGGPPA